MKNLSCVGKLLKVLYLQNFYIQPYYTRNLYIVKSNKNNPQQQVIFQNTVGLIVTFERLLSISFNIYTIVVFVLICCMLKMTARSKEVSKKILLSRFLDFFCCFENIKISHSNIFHQPRFSQTYF